MLLSNLKNQNKTRHTNLTGSRNTLIQQLVLSLNKTYARHKKILATLTVLAVLFTTFNPVINNLVAKAANSLTNPQLSSSCGLDIALVLDNSGSIGSDIQTMRTAFINFTNKLLPATNSLFSITFFNGTAGYTQKTFIGNIATVTDAVQRVPESGGFTNWQDGLLKARLTFDPRTNAKYPNLIIFASDGMPNRYFTDLSDPLNPRGLAGQGGFNQESFDAAVIQANIIKSSDTRIITLGIALQDDTASNRLKALSSEDAHYTANNFSDLGATLSDLASDLCGGAINSTPTPTPTINPQLNCSPQSQTINEGQIITLTATGGNGNYYWFGSGGTPFSYLGGSTFTVRFNRSGTYHTYVQSDINMGSCEVIVLPLAVIQTPTPTPAPISTPHPTTTPQINTSLQLSLQKLGKNITRGENTEQTGLSASPNDTLEFVIKIRSLSSTTVNNVILKDVLPGGLETIRNTTSINGVITSEGIAASGINIGSISPNQELVIRTSAQVGPTSSFVTGTTTLINTAQVGADGISAFSTQLPIIISNTQIAGASTSTIAKVAGVATGTTDSLILSLLLSVLATFIYMRYTQTGIFKKQEAWSVIKKHRADKNKFNFVS